MSTRHFVKYTFLRVEPAWRRLPGAQREQDKREFMAACEDFADGHLLQSFSLVGTRGDADLLLISEAENLERIHEFHVVLGQSGLMRWAGTPHSFLGMRKSSEYSEDERTVGRAFRDFLFERMIPNLKRVGLLTESVRPKFEALGVLKWEDAVHDGLIDWATLEKPLPVKAVLAAE